jgi:hypothetical protein
MADDINKKISIDVQVNPDGHQQIDQYKASFDSLRDTINGLGKPLTDLAKNIGLLDKDLAQISSSVDKYAAKIVDSTQKANDQQAKINAASNQKLKTSLSEAERIKEQSLINELQIKNSKYGEMALSESQSYIQQKRKLDDLLKNKKMSQQLYDEEAEQRLKEHYDKLRQIVDQYIKDNPELTANGTTKVDIAPLPTIQKSEQAKQKNEQAKQDQQTAESKKSLFSKILGYFVKTEEDKSKAATDSATKTNTKIAAEAKTFQDLIGAKTIASTQQVSDSAYKIFTDSIQVQSQAKIRSLEADKKRALSAANLTKDQQLAIENDYKQKELKVAVKAFKEKQKADIAQAVINGAVAITKVSAQAGIAAPFLIGAVIAETAAQVAKIASTKPPTTAMAKGGVFQSDGKGAVLPGYSRTDNTNAYLRSGEAVVVSEAMRDPWARNLVSAINVAYGGRDFSIPNVSRGYAVGGIFTDGGNANRYYNQPVNDQKNLANTVAYQMINNFPPVYVDVKDVNNQQNILAQTVNRVNL